MKKSFNYLILVIVAGLVLSAASCSRSSTDPTGETPLSSFPKEEVTLEYYRLWDDNTVLDEIIKDYHKLHKNINISVHKIAMPEDKTIYDYQNDLVKQIADGEGPDIFMIHNDWLPYQANQISPVPSNIMTPEIFKQKYPQVVVDDFLSNNKIYALPYYIDNLMLFYNADLFTAAKIPREKTPPKTWADVTEIVPKLTKKNTDGSIAQSAINLGLDDQWIPRFAEIIATLIMQYGGTMTSPDHTKAIFDLPINADKPYYPAESALNFYTDFANPSAITYTYSDATTSTGSKKFPSDIQAFMEGKMAMFIGYSYQVNNIKQYTGKRISFATAPLPQVRLEEPINIANYWGETVSKNSKYPQVAWDFINYVSQKSNLRTYLNNTGHVSALNGMDDTYDSKPYLAPIYNQIKISKSWYRNNSQGVEVIFAKMVNNILHHSIPVRNAVDLAVQEINTLTQKPWAQ